jgi:hypothetical protein
MLCLNKRSYPAYRSDVKRSKFLAADSGDRASFDLPHALAEVIAMQICIGGSELIFQGHFGGGSDMIPN